MFTFAMQGLLYPERSHFEFLNGSYEHEVLWEAEIPDWIKPCEGSTLPWVRGIATGQIRDNVFIIDDFIQLPMS